VLANFTGIILSPTPSHRSNAKATAQYFVEMDEKAVREENQLAHYLSKSLGSADFMR
jgi:hypothetical protein